ncbi:hypothetical protein Adt_12764 [Abeliophyllum distichum]|uniref:DUF7356 domain-containing protein n=1 Tax=Abeliophyllum distichum TaxID=126358 RepID=A0ABD1URM0_9LAMI
MKIEYTTLMLTIVLTSVVFHCAIAESEVNGPPKADLDMKLSVNSKVSDGDGVDKKVDMVKKGVDVNLDMVKKGVGVNLNKEDSTKQLEPKKANDDDLRNGQKDNKGLDSKSKEGSKVVRLPPPREKCDSSSYSCTDDDKSLIACLRVPGDDSPDLSLLIQNEGKGPVEVTISAPDSVQLEKKKIHIPEKEYSEVRVSIKSAGSSDFIILTAGHGNCSLDFRDQIGRKNVDSTSEFIYINHFKRTLSIGFVLLAALAVLSIWTCTKFLRRHFARNPKYQKLEMELPVSHGRKLESVSNDGWDDSWGDSWDDEEASKTPSLPVTPNLSSKGIASRRFSKESWKD